MYSTDTLASAIYPSVSMSEKSCGRKTLVSKLAWEKVSTLLQCIITREATTLPAQYLKHTTS